MRSATPTPEDLSFINLADIAWLFERSGAGAAHKDLPDPWCKKKGLTFTGEDSAMSRLLLSMMGAFAEFERALIRERQREGIQAVKKAGVYKGCKKMLTTAQVSDLRQRAEAGESKASIARDFGISRETVYQYLKAVPSG